MTKKFTPLQIEEMFTDEILELIDNADEYTRSDLQGAVAAIVKSIIHYNSL